MHVILYRAVFMCFFGLIYRCLFQEKCICLHEVFEMSDVKMYKEICEFELISQRKGSTWKCAFLQDSTSASANTEYTSSSGKK